jgi:hypothetical protein
VLLALLVGVLRNFLSTMPLLFAQRALLGGVHENLGRTHRAASGKGMHESGLSRFGQMIQCGTQADHMLAGC